MPKREKAQLKWGMMEYLPAYSASKSENEIRKEYSRLRKIAQKRLSRMVGTEWEETQTFQKNYGNYPTLSEIQTPAQLRKKLGEIARYINAETSGVTGLRRQRRLTIETLKDMGYTFVNTKNYRKFTEFMDEFRHQKLNKIYDSEAALTVFEGGERFKVPEDEIKDKFDAYLEKSEEIENMPIPRNPKARNSDYFRKNLGMK